MKKLNFNYILTVLDALHHLLPFELLLGFLWGLCYSAIYIIDQEKSRASWSILETIFERLRAGQELLSMTMLIMALVYMLILILILVIWVRKDKISNFFRTINDTRKLRQGMSILNPKIGEVLLKQYRKALKTARCIVTKDNIIISVQKTNLEEVDRILQKKFLFSGSYLCQTYNNLYVFSDVADMPYPGNAYIIRGSRCSSD